jgi:hypothetical protein
MRRIRLSVSESPQRERPELASLVPKAHEHEPPALEMPQLLDVFWSSSDIIGNNKNERVAIARIVLHFGSLYLHACRTDFQPVGVTEYSRH